MDALRELLEDLKRHGQANGNFLGLLHLLIGRQISRADGTSVSKGLTWRDLATWLKKVRWDPESVGELGLKPQQLAPRDRQRYWYLAIVQAGVDSQAAIESGERLAVVLRQQGYVVSPPPGKYTAPGKV